MPVAWANSNGGPSPPKSCSAREWPSGPGICTGCGPSGRDLAAIGIVVAEEYWIYMAWRGGSPEAEIRAEFAPSGGNARQQGRPVSQADVRWHGHLDIALGSHICDDAGFGAAVPRLMRTHRRSIGCDGTRRPLHGAQGDDAETEAHPSAQPRCVYSRRAPTKPERPRSRTTTVGGRVLRELPPRRRRRPAAFLRESRLRTKLVLR
jgi:hypothetical protein